MSGPILGGGEQLARSLGARNTGAGSNSFHTSGATFKRGQVTQALIDCFKVVSAAILVLVTGLGLFAGLFFLFFVRM